MPRRTSLLLLASATAALCAQAQDARVVTRIVSDTVPAWKTWKADAGSMNYPGAWAVAPAAQGDTAVVFRKPATGPSPRPLVAVIAGEHARQPASAKDLVPDEEGVQVIASSGPDETGACSVEFTGMLHGVPVHTLKRAVVQGGRTYLIVYSAPEKSYEENLFLAEAMMNSFSPGDR